MYRMELFECSAVTPIQLHLKAGSTIRVQSGRLWLTVEGQSEDIWLRASEQWTVPRDLKAWLSAEPIATFGLLHAVLPADARRAGQARTQSAVARAIESVLAYAVGVIRAIFKTTRTAY